MTPANPTPDDPRTFGPDDPITFAEAAEICLRGVVKAATLRAAWERRELTAERLGRRVVTTPRAVAEWRKRCSVAAEAPAYTSSIALDTSPIGISETGQSVSQLDLARASIAALLENSPNTSRGRQRHHSGKATRTASKSRP
jgi:hypothetical protein